MVVASCRNKYYGTNFISAVPTSLLIAPGLRTIQFLFLIQIRSEGENLGREMKGPAAHMQILSVCLSVLGTLSPPRWLVGLG
jgi:hypothetical protein